MSILLFLIPMTLLIVLLGGIAFFWAVNHDQFDDMETPALQPLTDGDPQGDPARNLESNPKVAAAPLAADKDAAR